MYPSLLLWHLAKKGRWCKFLIKLTKLKVSCKSNALCRKDPETTFATYAFKVVLGDILNEPILILFNV